MTDRPSSPRPEAKPDNVIALSRYRAQLGRGRRARNAEDLFSSSDPAHAIRTLPPDEFFYVVHELGFPDALEVLIHGTPEQVQTALDFAVWDRDQIAFDRMGEWLEAMVDAPYQKVGAWVKGLDVELVALILRKRARIYDLSMEEPPDEPEGMLLNTPDRLFALDLLGEHDDADTTARLLDAMYRFDQDFVRRILVGTRAEVDAELEETAYQWRSGRMADLGFIDFYEALEVYRELDPASVQLGEGRPTRLRPTGASDDGAHLRIPTALAERLAAGSAFARAMGGVSAQEELAEIHYALVALSNRTLTADRVTPGDDQAVAVVLERVSATLDLAVEFLARGDEARAVEAVRTVPIMRLFRLGVSLVGKVRRLGLALLRETPFSSLRPAVDLFEREDAEVLEAVTRIRPLFPRRLEDPPAAGERPFASLADLAVATSALERAAAAIALVYALGARPADLLPEALTRRGVTDRTVLDTGVLARTALVQALVGLPVRPLEPVDGGALEAFGKKFPNAAQDPAARARLEDAARAVLRTISPATLDTPAMAAVTDRWIASLAPLESVLAVPRAGD